jgi:hypothetical protein
MTLSYFSLCLFKIKFYLYHCSFSYTILSPSIVWQLYPLLLTFKFLGP